MDLDKDAVTQSLFYPRPETIDYVPVGIATATFSDGATIAGYLHESQSSDTLLLFFHGNGETAADYDSIASIYTECGVSFWVVDYRGYGRSTGSPSFSKMLHDAEVIFSDIARVGESLGRKFKQIIVMGRSLGSASAIHLGSKYSNILAGLILDSPYADLFSLVARIGGPKINSAKLTEFEDNRDKIRKCYLPTLIIHGVEDEIIPISEADLLFKRCPFSAKQILRIDEAGHNNLLMIGFKDYRDKLQNYISQINS